MHPPPDSEGLHEPLPRPLERTLRLAVLGHVEAERRRRHPTVVHVGRPGGGEVVFACAAGDPDDLGVRTDVLLALLSRVDHPEPLVWITRPGDLETQDDDACWLAATRAAAGELDRPVELVLVGRHGWRDPRSGLSRSWKRLRARSG
ncbi:hypothetical protein ABKW28_04055 [Nocardioides sp. 31GB23]|uniref:Uncharacterized protein n=1 Tax=Nocardioides salarius TaxID=374513 RepID=A0ABS2MG53_9ACTN|nr:hypothetical protein [Nocardioides salarius]MBM7510164.1 hypothetical protein [Nocardioides salarius]